jgi:hypothetical protein
VSLVGLQLLAEIDHALRYAKEKPDVWFGGIVVIFAGDFYQFLPVGSSPLYTPISLYAGQSDSEVQKRLGRLAWKTVNTVINLTDQQRMKEDPGYGDAVNRLWVRKCTEEDVELFTSRLIKSVTNPDGIDMGDPDNFHAAAIVGTNQLREVLNARKAETACEKNMLIVCAALDKHLSCELSYAEHKTLLWLNVATLKAAHALPGYVMLFEGMPVIL